MNAPPAMWPEVEDGELFGLIAADTLYLRVDAGNRPQFERAGSRPFTPYAGRASKSYYEVPVSVFEDASVLTTWARQSIDVAVTSKQRRTKG